jgi:integrase
MKLKSSALEVKENLLYILESKKSSEEKIVQIQALGLVEEKVTQGIIISGFSAVLTQNEEILERNKDLKNQITLLAEQVSELERLRGEERAKEKRQEAHAKRKRLAKRDPITLSIYEELITSISGSDFKSIRLRIACLILAITGIRLNELLPLKMKQLIPLINSNWISINRSKRGPSSHKAYLTALGKKLVDDRKQDFKILFSIKELEGYVFSSEKHQYKPLRRDTLTKEINLVLRKLGESLDNKPNLTSHSFRIGFISQLWRDTGDIEFVRQAIVHSKLESTSSYVENLSDEDRRLRMEQITSPEYINQIEKFSR